ncbi:ATP-binding protein [Acidithiobacillus ferriphilus]|uniref:hypothetical protein n=1 Tax=Acidithiobacillus ferriphilus TaxID=1689834 RepID=UPI001C071184|nr:hypothetical protein [Acidithiobacillus ferriphilus]MBU2829223.1 hypothetical protein [Acidithiobacillus ferriphilus]
MAKDPWHCPRTALADQYLKTLGIGLSKSLVLFAQRRMGKTEFLRKDLLPAAEKAGYITIYVSLWESREDPQSVLLDAIRKAAEGEGIISGVRRWLGRPGSKIGVGANASTVGVQASWEQGTAEASERMLDLRQWMNTLAQKKNPTLLLVDEIQTLADERRYGALVAALRSALDKHGDQIKAVFTGSSSEGLRRMFQMEKAPFYQFSHQIPFPQLGPEFVQHMLRAFANATQRQLNEAEAWQAFTDLALVPEHFRLMMANMAQLGSTDIAAALEEVKTAIQNSAEYPSKWAELTPIDQNMPLVP